MAKVVDGLKWKKIEQNFPLNTVLIPFDLYTDDFECDNPLGSNSGTNKISAFYFSFPTFPSYLTSSIKYVFEALLFPSNNKKNDFFWCIDE